MCLNTRKACPNARRKRAPDQFINLLLTNCRGQPFHDLAFHASKPLRASVPHPAAPPAAYRLLPYCQSPTAPPCPLRRRKLANNFTAKRGLNPAARIMGPMKRPSRDFCWSRSEHHRIHSPLDSHRRRIGHHPARPGPDLPAREVIDVFFHIGRKGFPRLSALDCFAQTAGSFRIAGVSNSGGHRRACLLQSRRKFRIS